MPPARIKMRINSMFLLLYVLVPGISCLRFFACSDEVAYSKSNQDQDQKLHFDLLCVLPDSTDAGSGVVLNTSGLLCPPL
jgi:hypothetical protein